jgi:HEAT repeat protein
MDHSVTFARHFARLVWLLLHEPTNTDEQKASLRALVTVAREGTIALATDGVELTANGTPLPAALSGMSEVVARMEAHGLRVLDVDRAPTAGDLLGAARTLAAEVADATHPATTASVRFVVRGRTPGSAPAVPGVTAAAGTTSLPDLGFGDVLDDPWDVGRERGTPHQSTPAIPAVPTARPAAGAGREGGGMFDQFVAARSPTTTLPDLLARLDAETAPAQLIGLLDALATRAEEAMRDGVPAQATEIFFRVVRRERDAHAFDVKRAFVLTVKRLTKPALLRAVVADLPRKRREEALAVLARTGEEGADVLIEQLASEEGRKQRLSYYDALVHLQAGVPTLLHMLGDARWYVARNAAALLGEMQAREAEKPLAALLHHDDERVRHAATISLMRLGTARSLPTIQEALKDGAPRIRMEAAAALVGRRESNVTSMLVRALDDERDDEVSASFLIALGRLGTPDAVSRLIATAEPDKGMFRRKPVALRVAAVQGLAEARTDEALDALKSLQGDKDEDVRATAVYALGRRARQDGDAG